MSGTAEGTRRLLAAFNANRPEDVADLITDDFVDHHVPAEIPHGLEGLTMWSGIIPRAFDGRIDIDDLIEQNDRVASDHARQRALKGCGIFKFGSGRVGLATRRNKIDTAGTGRRLVALLDRSIGASGGLGVERAGEGQQAREKEDKNPGQKRKLHGRVERQNSKACRCAMGREKSP